MKHILFIAAILLSSTFAFADGKDTMTTKETFRRYYTSNSVDGAIFSTAAISKPSDNKLGTLRFSYFFNAGTAFNFNFSNHIGAFTGIDLKNIGFIEKESGVTSKRRTYNLGVPVGLKIGNMSRRGSYIFLGGGVDAPINFKEKTFTSRNHKTKFNEWFSDRTPALMPYLFVGVKLRSNLNLKAQYYPGNFLNPNFKDKDNFSEYAGYDVHLMMLSIGYTTPGKSKHHMKKGENKN